MKFDTFTIRTLAEKDASLYFSLIHQNKERLKDYFPKTLEANNTISATSVHIQERLELAEKRVLFTFIVSDNSTGNIIGSVFIKDLDWRIPKGELGFFIDKAYEGKGIITKSVSLITEHCFANLELNKVFMRIAEDNIASRRVAEKNNFQVEGILRKDFKTSDGKLIDLVYYGLIGPFVKDES